MAIQQSYDYNILNTMQLKQDNPLLIHRPRKRRNLVVEPKTEQKSQNLKALHQTLLCQNSYRKKPIVVERTSINKMMNYNSRSLSKRQVDSSKEKERPMNFYINIERLKNLKISQNKEQRTKSSQAASNPYMSRDKLNVQRRSQLLRRYNGGRKQQHQSQEQIYQSVNRLSQERQPTRHTKSKMRYKTDVEEETNVVSDQNNKNVKNAGFKRAHHELNIKDKSFIQGYLRGKQLGRGGFSKVWEGFHFKSKTFFAVKQIDTTNKYQTHLTEIWFGNYFFENGSPKRQFVNHQGINSLLKMYNYSIMEPRAFLVYENCNGSLGNMLYDIYEEDRQEDIDEDDKLYMIKYKSLYSQLRKNTTFIKTMIYQIAQALDLLVEQKIVHSDIKTENILLNIQENSPRYGFKLIDYGSSFIFQNLKQYKLATPQYMCPQLLNYILYQNKKPHREEMLSFVKKYENISAIDIWGLGCILVQLIHGLPLWLSNRTKILVNGRYETKRGLFAVSDRSFSKILERQLHVVQNFETFLKKQNNSGIAIDDTLKILLKKMLVPDPSKRIRPHEIIEILISREPTLF